MSIYEKPTSHTTSTGTRPAPTVGKSTAGPSPTAAGPDLTPETADTPTGDPDESVVGGAAERIEHRRNLVESRPRSYVVLGTVGVLAAALLFGVYLFFAGI